MYYPIAFANEALRLFPHVEELHRKIAKGDITVGRYLSDAATGTVSAQKLLRAVTIGEVHELAERSLSIQALYHWWGQLYDEDLRVRSKARPTP